MLLGGNDFGHRFGHAHSMVVGWMDRPTDIWIRDLKIGDGDTGIGATCNAPSDV